MYNKHATVYHCYSQAVSCLTKGPTEQTRMIAIRIKAPGPFGCNPLMFLLFSFPFPLLLFPPFNSSPLNLPLWVILANILKDFFLVVIHVFPRDLERRAQIRSGVEWPLLICDPCHLARQLRPQLTGYTHRDYFLMLIARD